MSLQATSAPIPSQPLLSVREVTERLNVSADTVYRLVARGELRKFKIGYLTRFAAEDVDALLARALRNR